MSLKWKQWIARNLERGVSKDYIFSTLLENGFSYEAVTKEMKYELKIKQFIPNSWKIWLQKNILMGQDKDGLFKVLLMNGFSYDAIKEEMQYIPSIPLEDLRDPFTSVIQKHNGPGTLKKTITLLREKAVKLETHKLDIFSIESFLDDIECEYLIKLIRNKLRPSTLASSSEDKLFRTSRTCDLAEFNDRTATDINARICDLVGIQSELSEPLQGQFYEVGQEFKPHTDFFENSELEENGTILGQRNLTVMIYLNSTESGGETTFPLINAEFSPERGKAVIWSNLNADLSPNHNSLHHGKKVLKGYKAIITKWFRTGVTKT